MGHKRLRKGETPRGLLGPGKRGVWTTVGMLVPPTLESPPKDSSVLKEYWVAFGKGDLHEERGSDSEVKQPPLDGGVNVLGYRHGDSKWLSLSRI